MLHPRPVRLQPPLRARTIMTVPTGRPCDSAEYWEDPNAEETETSELRCRRSLDWSAVDRFPPSFAPVS